MFFWRRNARERRARLRVFQRQQRLSGGARAPVGTSRAPLSGLQRVFFWLQPTLSGFSRRAASARTSIRAKNTRQIASSLVFQTENSKKRRRKKTKKTRTNQSCSDHFCC